MKLVLASAFGSVFCELSAQWWQVGATWKSRSQAPWKSIVQKSDSTAKTGGTSTNTTWAHSELLKSLQTILPTGVCKQALFYVETSKYSALSGTLGDPECRMTCHFQCNPILRKLMLMSSTHLQSPGKMACFCRLDAVDDLACSCNYASSSDRIASWICLYCQRGSSFNQQQILAR